MHPMHADRFCALRVLAERPEIPSPRSQGEALPALRAHPTPDAEAELRRIKWRLHRFFVALWP